jgi:predicted ATP-binding protein involved in virulence
VCAISIGTDLLVLVGQKYGFLLNALRSEVENIGESVLLLDLKLSQTLKVKSKKYAVKKKFETSIFIFVEKLKSMPPKKKPAAELQAIQGLVNTFKNILTCVQKDDGYYFTEKDKDSDFYFWIKSLTPDPLTSGWVHINYSSKPYSQFELNEGSGTVGTDMNKVSMSLSNLLSNWLNIIRNERNFDYTSFDKIVPKLPDSVPVSSLVANTLQQLTITDFKSISHLSINFDKEVTILLGKNASGKTTILQALALALLPDDNTDKDREFEKMIKIGRERAILKHNFTIADQQQETIILPNRKKKTINNHVDIIILGYGTNMFYNKGEKNKFQDFVKAMLFGNANHYSTRSLFRNFDDNFVDILDVLNHLYYEEQREKEEIIRNNSQEIRTLIAQTINDLLPKDLIQIKLVEERSYYFVNQAGDNLDTDQLSEGYRANVILLGDMLCRLMAMRGHLQAMLKQENPIPIAEVFKEMRGIVIIDEFDRHLHPSWQKVFVDNLIKVLPNMQFVLTTHNPMAILNRNEDEVLKLVFNEDGQIVTQTGHATADLDVSLVLLEYFEMDSLVSEQLQAKIERYQEAKLNDESIAEALGKELEDLLATLPIHDKLYWQYLKFLRDKGISFSDLQLNKIDLKSLFTNQ